MGYASRLKGLTSIGTNGPTSVGATGDLSRYLVHSALEIDQIGFVVTTAIVSTAPVIVTVYRRPTPGSTTGQVSLGTLSIPGGTAAGAKFYKRINKPVVYDGEELAFNCSTAATTSGAGIGYAGGFERDEIPANLPNMTASA